MSECNFVRLRFILLTAALVLLLPAIATAQAVTTQVTATDFFDPFGLLGNGPVGAILNYGTLTCPGTQPTGNTMQPCPPGSRIKLQGIAWKSRVISQDPLLLGWFFAEGNFELDDNAAGRMAGTFRIELDSGGVWEGSWTGEKNKVENAEAWILRARYVGNGTSGNVDGLHLRITDAATILTPLGFVWIGAIDGQVLAPASR
jgi:hypothetical protein